MDLEARQHHTRMKYILAQIAIKDTDTFFATFSQCGNIAYLRHLWSTMGQQLPPDQHVSNEGMSVWHRNLGEGFEVVILTLPPPVASNEAYFVGVVRLSNGICRVFCLERSVMPSTGEEITMLSELTASGRFNLGLGTEPVVEEFAVMLIQSVSDPTTDWCAFVPKQLDKKHYTDLVKAGGLANALKKVIGGLGGNLTVCDMPNALKKALAGLGYDFTNYTTPYHCAVVEEGSRFTQIYIAAEERLFIFDFRSQGVTYANGSTDNLSDVAQGIYTWIKEKASIKTMQTRFKFFVPTEAGKAHEADTYVEYQWQELKTIWKKLEKYLLEHYPSPSPLIEAAMKKPELRMLFPSTRLNRLCFSRTTGSPYTQDCPHAVPLGNGIFRAYSSKVNEKQKSFDIIGEGNPDEVIEMLVNHLPPDCGPAINGTADDFVKNKEC